MASGITYDLTPTEVEHELWNQATSYRLAGGVNLEDKDLAQGSYLPVLAPLEVDFSTRQAVAVKNVRIADTTTPAGLSIKIEKHSLAYVGMFIGNGTKGAKVISISKYDAGFDTLNLETALEVVIQAKEVLFEAVDVTGKKARHTAHFMNYARTKVEAGASVTLLGQAYEIQEGALYAPITEENKKSLSTRFMFV